MKQILIPLAQGFEEIEAITNIDILRRAGLDVLTAGLEDIQIEGGHGVKIETDIKISEVDVDNLEAVVLPGGMPGAANLKDNNQLRLIIEKLNEQKKLCAAICAAPIVLYAAGILDGKNVTSYPGFDKEMSQCNYLEERVVIDGNIVTGRGPGVAMEFALTLVEYLLDTKAKIQLEEGMLV